MSCHTLITGFSFERQFYFYKAYTNAIFKLFQDELRSMLDGVRYVFHVTDMVEGKHEDL
ncbi:hypothetical protein OROGR_028879 [Orobanche gracilis]